MWLRIVQAAWRGSPQPAQAHEMSAKEDHLESLMSHLGEFGKYQLYQCILLIITALTAGMHTLSIVPINGIPNHRCQVPWLENETDLAWDSPTALAAIPLKPDGSYSSCLLINPTTNLTEACDKWVYDKTHFKHSRTVEWDLVCDKKWLGALSKSIFMLGVFTGSFTLGILADKYGRKKTQCCTQTIQLIISIGIAFINNYYVYLVASFLYGVFGSAGSYIPAFVIAMELVGPSKRTTWGLVFQAMFAVGIMLVALWAYLIPDYFTLQVVIGLHVLLAIGNWWFADSIAYYGLSLASDNMVGNPFFILFVLGLVEIPSYILVILMLDRTGRRSLTSIMMLLGAASCIVVALIPKDMPNIITAIACLGKFCVSGGFAIIFNYSAELLPTVVRNVGIGFGSACARLAAMLCPLILLLDSIDKSLPTIIFALAAFTSGFFTLFLPETLNKPMPQSMEDGENFGVGDTAFNACCSKKKNGDYMPANPI
ncbi:unnamed protein product [Nezara viridula]|uniref:Major facilitator superfamily (MFS) profile domain-containing protein n=1 Tax=Nezara viridula TaxID=85310 RepID=A0A9P0HHI0_NEZVI|nr:unnamed protein product [Nezara viridula]